jgi:hypothetical protein
MDDGWKYEPRLPEALDALNNASVPLDGRLWAEVLVPFISSLFIRGLEFIQRYQSRLPGLTGPPEDDSPPLFPSWHDNTLAGRDIEWQRILAPIMSAEWTVVHGSGEPLLITNDVGHCLMVKKGHQPGDDVSYAFPITSSSILVLERRVVRRILDWDDHGWTAPIVHRDVPDWELVNCRQAMQHAAQREVYGPTRDAVTFPTKDFRPSVPASGPEALFPHFPPADRSTISNRPLLPYLYDYFKILTMLDSSPMEFLARPDSETFDPTVVARVWGGIFQVIVDMRPFPGGLAITPFAAYLDLGRFTAEDVRQSLGKQGEDLTPTQWPTEPRPELRELMVEDLQARGVDDIL